MHCERWCSLSDEELGKGDIAEINLAAAFDLPHAENLDIPVLRHKLDNWADRVDWDKECPSANVRETPAIANTPTVSFGCWRWLLCCNAIWECSTASRSTRATTMAAIRGISSSTVSCRGTGVHA